MTNAHEVPPLVRRIVPGLIGLVIFTLLLLPPGENNARDHDGYWDAERQVWVERHDDSWAGPDLGRILGQFTFHFLIASLVFAYRWPLGPLVGNPVRTRFHRGIGLAVLALAVAHAAVLLPLQVWRGWISGVLSVVTLVTHGALGLWKPALVARMGTARWRYVHLATAWAGLLIGLQHALVYGQHYGLFREALLGGH